MRFRRAPSALQIVAWDEYLARSPARLD
jgi:hypothetical protein